MSRGGMSRGGMSRGGMSRGGMSRGGMSRGGMSRGSMSRGSMSRGSMSRGGMSRGGMSRGGMSRGGMSRGGMSRGGMSRRPSGGGRSRPPLPPLPRPCRSQSSLCGGGPKPEVPGGPRGPIGPPGGGARPPRMASRGGGAGCDERPGARSFGNAMAWPGGSKRLPPPQLPPMRPPEGIRDGNGSISPGSISPGSSSLAGPRRRLGGPEPPPPRP